MTLLEVTLAMGLLVLLSSMTYWFYSSVLETKAVETQRVRKLRLSRVTLDRLVTEIRQTSLVASGGGSGFRGGPEHIWLSTLRVPTRRLMPTGSQRDEPPTPQTDLVHVEYWIVRNPDILHQDGYELALGLARVEVEVPRSYVAQIAAAPQDSPEEATGDELDNFAGLGDEELLGDTSSGGGPDLGPDVNWAELYAPEIRFLRLCYFDGNKWWNDWDVGGENPLPQLVRVTIGFAGAPPYGEDFGTRDDEEFCTCLNEDPIDCDRLPPDQFMAVVRLPLADPLFRSRLIRESQAFIEELGGGSPEDAEDLELP
ncbi:MAG: hypothetical protein IID43_01700 [Planctomycetes bacterium]|nr:hypothetical protein [Planctomycetota bacterium]